MMSLERIKALQIRAIQHGGVVNYHTDRYGVPTTVEWDIAGRCESPVPVELVARAGIRVEAVTRHKLARFRAAVRGFARIIMHTACRKCSTCRRRRQRMWYMRSRQEFENASRNWFGTLTFTPEEHFMCETRCRDRLAKQGVDFEALTGPEKFSERIKDLGRHVTLFIKRVRKNSGAPVRYLLVAEAHKSGLPHFHLLLHERDIVTPVRWKHLSEAWPHGFSTFKLARDQKSALYLTKYLTKTMDVRVRASLYYGEACHHLSDSKVVNRRVKSHRHNPLTSGAFTTSEDVSCLSSTVARKGEPNGNELSHTFGTARLSECAETVAGTGAPRPGVTIASRDASSAARNQSLAACSKSAETDQSHVAAAQASRSGGETASGLQPEAVCPTTPSESPPACDTESEPEWWTLGGSWP